MIRADYKEFSNSLKLVCNANNRGAGLLFLSVISRKIPHDVLIMGFPGNHQKYTQGPPRDPRGVKFKVAQKSINMGIK